MEHHLKNHRPCITLTAGLLKLMHPRCVCHPLRMCCWGCLCLQSDERTHTRTTVFPPSWICSIFPQEFHGIHPISFHPASLEQAGTETHTTPLRLPSLFMNIIIFAAVCILSMKCSQPQTAGGLWYQHVALFFFFFFPLVIAPEN